MSGDVTYWIELAVGAGCLAAAAGALRAGGRTRWVGLVLVVAGVAAVAHALVALLSREA